MAVNVLIVDDSSFFRKRLGEILSQSPQIQVVGTASNGREGVELAAKLKPDVITMDYEMPIMDGVMAVRTIMSTNPTPILMFSSLTYEGARVTLDALEAGAVDFLPKNFEDITRSNSELQRILTKRIISIAKPKAAASSSPTPQSAAPAATTASAPAPGKEPPARFRMAPKPPAPAARTKPAAGGGKIKHPVNIVVIGCSTGGPVALQKVLTGLPGNFPKPILVVQHMPASFTPAFSERLNSLCAIGVKQAEEGDRLKPGVAYIAPGGKQMVVNMEGSSPYLHVVEGDTRLTYKPSVDITFGSTAKRLPGKALGIVLTGMGSDGREGCRMLKQTGSTVWTQTEKSCVIYGMPMAVDKAGYSDESVDISNMAERIISGIR